MMSTNLEQKTVVVPMYVEDNRHKCCCNLMHVKNGAILAGFLNVLFAIGVISILIFLSFYDPEERVAPGFMVYGPIICVVNVVAVVIMMIGIVKERSIFLVPYLIVQTACIVSTLISVLLTVALTIVESAEKDHSQNVMYQWFMLFETMDNAPNDEIGPSKMSESRDFESNLYWFSVFLLILSVLLVTVVVMATEIWFLIAAYSCFVYLREKEAAIKNSFHPDRVTIKYGSTDDGLYDSATLEAK